jgi:hypothetical protein
MTGGASVFKILQGASLRALFRPASQGLPRRAAAMTLLALGLSGCANMSDSFTTAFADPAKYDLWDCKQLEPERKVLAKRAAELEGLMAKAQTGTAGPVVAELAYRNEYVAVRGQTHFADEVWRRNKCHDSPAAAATSTESSSPPPRANARPAPPSRSGSAVY